MVQKLSKALPTANINQHATTQIIVERSVGQKFVALLVDT